MATTPLERLTALEQELQDLTIEPWSNVEAWTAKATPIIRRDWPDHFDDFQKAAKTPQWTALPIAFGRDEAEDRVRSTEISAIEKNSNRGIANRAKDKLLMFLDGLIAIAVPPVVAPKKRERHGRKTVSKNRNGGDRKVDARKVFVVHGRNSAAREALFHFLRAIGLHPLEWDEIVRETGEGSPYIGKVLEVGFSMVQSVVVLMTPDDEARLREPFRGKTEPAHEVELMPQPRPNVLVEAGMALGLHGDRTVIVEMGQLRPISDLFGRHVVRLDNTAKQRNALAQRLQTAGCTVNLVGTDWLSAGDFDAALPAPSPLPLSVASPPTDLFPSDGVLWASSEIGGRRVYRPHCPQCQRPLNRKADFVECDGCGFQELLTRREPSKPPRESPQA